MTANGSAVVLTVDQAAERAAISAKTIRRWIAAGRLQTLSAPGERPLIAEDALDQAIANPERAPSVPVPDMSLVRLPEAGLPALTSALTAALGPMVEEIRAAREQAQAELHAARERIATLEAVIRVQQAELQAAAEHPLTWRRQRAKPR